jgi:hypothetical protein
MIFNTVFRSTRGAAALGALAALASGRVAGAETVYQTPRQTLAQFFPKSERVRYERRVLTAGERELVQRRLGYPLARDNYVFYVATTGTHTDGYALIDDEQGQAEPITFAVKLSPQGVVERTEVLVYREPRGDEVRSRRFLDQLTGKTVTHAVRVGVDVDAVSGATISSHSLATGVRRALVLHDELYAHAARELARGPAR